MEKSKQVHILTYFLTLGCNIVIPEYGFVLVNFYFQ